MMLIEIPLKFAHPIYTMKVDSHVLLTLDGYCAIGVAHSSPHEHLSADMDSCVVNDPMIPSGSPRRPEPLSEALSESTLDASKLKEEAECLSSVIELVSHSPPCEATLVAKISYNCLSTGNELISHSSPVVELVEHADQTDEGTCLAVSEQGSYHQSAIASMPPLSFAGLKHSDLPSCDVLPIPISDEDRYATLGNFPQALDAVCTANSAHQSPSTLAEQNYLAHVKQLVPVDAHGQLRAQIVERSYITAADVGGLDDYLPSGPPDALLIGLDPESDIDSEPTPSPISRLAIKGHVIETKPDQKTP